MELLDFFEAVKCNENSFLDCEYHENQLFYTIDKTTSNKIEWGNYSIAIVGVEEDGGAVNNKGCALAPNEVRKYLYALSAKEKQNIIDLGNIKQGNTINDTYFALSTIVEQLVKNNIIPIIIGGSQDLTYANFLGYQNLEQTVNIVSVDSKFDVGDADQAVNASNYLSKIILHQPNYLFNYSNIGYQSYFVSKDEITLLDKLYFDATRLGRVQNNIEVIEPIIRNADMLSVDVSCIRQSEAPANSNTSPNGFYGEQACQIARYAGFSDKLTSVGFYEVNPTVQDNGQTAHLVAQMIWYFIDGFNNRKNDFPIGSRKNYIKYNVNILDSEHELVFFKSPKSDRWWMDVPYPKHEKIKYARHLLVPCNYSDYQTACDNEIPDKWWQTFNKLM